MSTALPFNPKVETIEDAVDEQLKISDELRQIRELVAQKDADLIALRTQLAQAQQDSLRAVTAASAASLNSERALAASERAAAASGQVLRAFEELRPHLVRLVGNGHG